MGNTDEVVNPHTFASGTEKALFRLCRGTCYFPLCERSVLIYSGGDPLVDVQIAHIAAAEEGGPRFDSEMSDHDRRAFSNLILLCQGHHTLVDKLHPEQYPAETLREWKASNEDQAMVSELSQPSITDATLEALLASVALSASPSRELSVELAPVVRSGRSGFSGPVNAFAEVFGPSSPLSDWPLALVVTVRNTGRLDVEVESIGLEWTLAGHDSPAVYYPPVDRMAHGLPFRLANGAAASWPVGAEYVRAVHRELKSVDVATLRSRIRLASGESFASEPVTWSSLAPLGFAWISPA